MKKKLNICGVNFDVYCPRNRSIKYTDWWSHLVNNGYANIYEAYARPSYQKEKVWNYWCDWKCGDSNIYNLYIISKNTFKFTIGCIYYDAMHDKYYGIKITGCNRIAFEID